MEAFFFLCNQKTEKECIEKKLVGTRNIPATQEWGRWF
jgi:hypothetical protein